MLILYKTPWFTSECNAWYRLLIFCCILYITPISIEHIKHIYTAYYAIHPCFISIQYITQNRDNFLHGPCQWEWMLHCKTKWSVPNFCAAYYALHKCLISVQQIKQNSLLYFYAVYHAWGLLAFFMQCFIHQTALLYLYAAHKLPCFIFMQHIYTTSMLYHCPYSNFCLHYLTHWGRVTHICVSKLTIIGSDNGLSPGRCQAIIRTIAGIWLIRNLGTKFR